MVKRRPRVDLAWMDDAPCRGQTDLFFPEPVTLQTAAPAFAICETCPLRRRCYDYAIDDSTLMGVWAGTTPAQRRIARHRRRLAG